MVIRDDLTEALLQENLALKEKVKSLMKMLKKDRLKNKDLEAKLEAKIYESSVDREIEKELNNTLEKGTKSTKRTTAAQLEVKRESLAEEEVLIVDIDEEEEEPGQGVGEEESVEEETFFLKGEPTSEEQRNPEEDLIDDVTANLEETVETKPRLLGELLQSFVQEMRPGPSQEMEELEDDLTLGNGANSEVANRDDISNLETSPVDDKSKLDSNVERIDSNVERNIVIGTRSLNSLSTDEAGPTLEKNSDGRYQCNICEFRHQTQSCVRNHIKGKHEGYRWKCDECGAKLTSPYIMKRHKDHHHTKRPGTSVSKKVKAKKGKDEPSQSEIFPSNPKNVANKVKVLSATKQNGQNAFHANSKSTKNPVDCKVCGKSISHNNLKRHMLNAHRVPWSSMNAYGVLLSSMEIHGVKVNGPSRKTEGNVQDINETIEQNFMSPGDAREVLNQIENFNEGVDNRITYPIEKNTDGKFQCNICSRSHPSKKVIKNHILGVHAGYKWNCNKCEKEFSSPTKLESHKIKVHAEDPRLSKQMRLSCNLCSKFFHKSGMGMHMKRKHA